MIKILLEGIHTNHIGEGYYDIDPLTSSVTLIQKDSKNILIDTGTPKFFQKIKEELAKHALTPDDIHYILNTHFHLDHCGCDAFFKNAIVWVGRSNLDYKTGRARVFTDTSKIKYPAGIQPLFTPGHTADHTSYLFEENGVKYVCSGDALREDTIRSQRIPRCQLPEKFVPSMKMIFEAADVIIPGHGRAIEDKLKKELYELVCGEWKTP